MPECQDKCFDKFVHKLCLVEVMEQIGNSGAQSVPIDNVDGLLKNVAFELNQYATDKELQHTDD
jgi:hypothetical protein